MIGAWAACPRGRENRAGEGRRERSMHEGIDSTEDARPAKVCSVIRGCGGRGAVIYPLIRALSPPACPRKSRVGANSPSLWPTIDSETKTGTCLRPSWTAIVWPTISGKIVDMRDHVFTICLLPEEFIASMRCIRRSSTHGPFFEDLLIARWPFPGPRAGGGPKIELDKNAGRSSC